MHGLTGSGAYLWELPCLLVCLNKPWVTYALTCACALQVGEGTQEHGALAGCGSLHCAVAQVLKTCGSLLQQAGHSLDKCRALEAWIQNV